MGGLKEVKQDGKDYMLYVEGDVKCEVIDRMNNFGQVGEMYWRFIEFEWNELIMNLVNIFFIC